MSSTTETPGTNKAIVFNLVPPVSILTTVQGDSSNEAVVSINVHDQTLWQQVLTQVAPQAVLPELIIQNPSVDVHIPAGAQLMLQIPTTISPGSVFFAGTVISRPHAAVEFSLMVAMWTIE